MTIKKLSAMPYAQAHVEIINGNTYLFSYVTCVAEIELDKNGDRWLIIHGLYSATTRRHISAFVNEYADCSYYTAKRLYDNGDKLNLETGEVEKI